MRLYHHAPNGVRGCLTLEIGKLILCLGYRKGVRGIDIVYKNRFIFTTDKRIEL